MNKKPIAGVLLVMQLYYATSEIKAGGIDLSLFSSFT